jgi:hypothetical protein
MLDILAGDKMQARYILADYFVLRPVFPTVAVGQLAKPALENARELANGERPSTTLRQQRAPRQQRTLTAAKFNSIPSSLGPRDGPRRGRRRPGVEEPLALARRRRDVCAAYCFGGKRSPRSMQA